MKKSLGLPGGPNQYVTDISEFISIEGYKRDSPDVNNPYNIIPSGNITMEDVDFAVKGTDNLGNELIMEPGGNYQFPGDSVLETRLAQNGIEVPYSDYSLRDVENDVNDWLGYSMSTVSDIDQVLSEDQMKTFNNFDQNIENQVATIYQEYKDKDVPYGSKNWKPFEMDSRVIALRKEQTDWEAANPVYQEARDLLNRASDPLRHSSSAAQTSKVLQQKVRDIPYVGGVLDFLGVDKAAGFVGSNLAGIGHEAVTIGRDERPWSIKGEEAFQDIYNNLIGSLVGNQNLNKEDTVSKLIQKYKSGDLSDGRVRGHERSYMPEDPNLFMRLLTNNPEEPKMKRGGGLLNKKVKCKSCGWSWDAADGGNDLTTCHKCGGEGLVQAQTGGQVKLSTTYKNYIFGDDNTDDAKKTYDKLNRIYYKQSKEAGMSPSNFIMTHVIGDS